MDLDWMDGKERKGGECLPRQSVRGMLHVLAKGGNQQCNQNRSVPPSKRPMEGKEKVLLRTIKNERLEVVPRYQARPGQRSRRRLHEGVASTGAQTSDAVVVSGSSTPTAL